MIKEKFHGRTVCRVLVVDDNYDTAQAMALLLRQIGAEVDVVWDGPKAIQRANLLLPDVVLLDLGLPRMHGHAGLSCYLRQVLLNAIRASSPGCTTVASRSCMFPSNGLHSI